jgi:hypothetical protein
MPAFSPATADTVKAAREAVAAAERTRAAECVKRGPLCRQREADEAAARAALSKATADKAARDRAAKLDTDAATVRARLATASPVASAADPGAAALSNYLATFGLSLPAGVVSEWMVLIGVVALELGSALSVVLVRAAAVYPPWTAPQSTAVDRQAPKRAAEPVDGRERVPAPETRRQRNAPVDAESARVAPFVRSTAVATGPGRKSVVRRTANRRLGQVAVATKADAQARLVDTLKAQGGRIEGASIRGLAALIGARRSNVHNALAALVAAGTVAKIGTALVLQA